MGIWGSVLEGEEEEKGLQAEEWSLPARRADGGSDDYD